MILLIEAALNRLNNTVILKTCRGPKHLIQDYASG